MFEKLYETKIIQKALKIKLIPVSRRDKALIYGLLEDYTALLREALDIVVRSDARSRKRAHKHCYKYLRGKYPHLPNKYIKGGVRHLYLGFTTRRHNDILHVPIYLYK
ncbi:MAG: hypothetical protein QXV15_06415 [Acidilobaceae archaeon]